MTSTSVETLNCSRGNVRTVSIIVMVECARSRARSSTFQRLRFTMLNKLDAPRIMVGWQLACALVVSSNRLD